jgi:hypothetical protein
MVNYLLEMIEATPFDDEIPSMDFDDVSDERAQELIAYAQTLYEADDKDNDATISMGHDKCIDIDMLSTEMRYCYMKYLLCVDEVQLDSESRGILYGQVISAVNRVSTTTPLHIQRRVELLLKAAELRQDLEHSERKRLDACQQLVTDVRRRTIQHMRAEEKKRIARIEEQEKRDKRQREREQKERQRKQEKQLKKESEEREERERVARANADTQKLEFQQRKAQHPTVILKRTTTAPSTSTSTSSASVDRPRRLSEKGHAQWQAKPASPKSTANSSKSTSASASSTPTKQTIRSPIGTPVQPSASSNGSSPAPNSASQASAWSSPAKIKRPGFTVAYNGASTTPSTSPPANNKSSSNSSSSSKLSSAAQIFQPTKTPPPGFTSPQTSTSTSTNASIGNYNRVPSSTTTASTSASASAVIQSPTLSSNAALQGIHIPIDNLHKSFFTSSPSPPPQPPADQPRKPSPSPPIFNNNHIWQNDSQEPPAYHQAIAHATLSSTSTSTSASTSDTNGLSPRAQHQSASPAFSDVLNSNELHSHPHSLSTSSLNGLDILQDKRINGAAAATWTWPLPSAAGSQGNANAHSREHKLLVFQQWLRQIDLLEYYEIFARQHVDLDACMVMTEQDVKDIQELPLGARIKLSYAIRQLQTVRQSHKQSQSQPQSQQQQHSQAQHQMQHPSPPMPITPHAFQAQAQAAMQYGGSKLMNMQAVNVQHLQNVPISGISGVQSTGTVPVFINGHILHIPVQQLQQFTASSPTAQHPDTSASYYYRR